MCQSIHIKGRGTIHTVGDLIDAIGADAIEIDDAYAWQADVTKMADYCLCSVDIPDTLIEVGYRVWREPAGDSMQYTCELVSAAEPASNAIRERE